MAEIIIKPAPSSGGGGGGNATVPADAPIQPPQAFVDCYPLLLPAACAHGDLDLTNRGLTHFEPGLLYGIPGSVLEASGSLGTVFLLFTGNNLPVADVNGLLAACVSFFNAFGQTTGINLSGGTNAAPTGQGLTDKATLISNGWTVTTN